MNSLIKPIYVCYYNYNSERNSYTYEVTDDLNYAKYLDPEYQLATLKDLHNWVAGCGEIFYGILSTKEGLCKWFECEYIDEYGDWDFDCGYRLI